MCQSYQIEKLVSTHVSLGLKFEVSGKIGRLTFDYDETVTNCNGLKGYGQIVHPLF